METAERTTMTYEDALTVFLGTDANYAGGLSNHGPMAVEALVHLGVPHWIGPFVSDYQGRLDVSAKASTPAPRDWQDWLGKAVGPYLSSVASLAGHGLLRVAHAVRALERVADGDSTDVHRRELSAAVEYWRSGGSGLQSPTRLTGPLPIGEWLETLGRLTVEERSEGLLTATFATAAGTPLYLDKVASLAPSSDPRATFDALGTVAATAFVRNQGTNAFALLHGATVSAMARVLVSYLDEMAARQLEASVAGFVAAAIIGFDDGVAELALDHGEPPSHAELAEAAGASTEDHTIKFVDACLDIAGRTGDHSLLVAAYHQITTPYGVPKDA